MWTQRLLTQALGITDQTVWDMENGDTSMDFDRRQFLSEWPDIPVVLLGSVTLEEILKMIGERKAAQSATPPVVSTAHATSRKHVIDVEEYSTLLTGYWTTRISRSAHISMADVLLRIDVLYRELPHVRDKKPIQELLCRYHDFVASLLRDQQKYDIAIEHLNKALRFAKLLNKDELKALVLYMWGYTLWEAGRLDEALQKYEEAKCYEQRLSINLRGALLLETGQTGAQAAKTPEKRREAIALVDRVGNMVRNNPKEEDPYFLTFNLDLYHQTRSVSLIAVGRNREAINELKLVKVGPEYPLRQARRDIREAQALINLGEYSEAACLAESGLFSALK